jgi:hypothetical protein
MVLFKLQLILLLSFIFYSLDKINRNITPEKNENIFVLDK